MEDLLNSSTETVEDIIEVASKLDQKQTSIKKGYNKLIDNINKKLGVLKVNTTRGRIEYEISSWENDDGEERQITLDLGISPEYGMYVSLQLGRQTYEFDRNTGDDTHEEWEWECLENPSHQTIKRIISKLSSIFAYYIDELKKMDSSDTAIITTLDEILAKFPDTQKAVNKKIENAVKA